MHTYCKANIFLINILLLCFFDCLARSMVFVDRVISNYFKYKEICSSTYKNTYNFQSGPNRRMDSTL